MKKEQDGLMTKIANQDLLSEMEMLNIYGGDYNDSSNGACLGNGGCKTNGDCYKNGTCTDNSGCSKNGTCKSDHACTSNGPCMQFTICWFGKEESGGGGGNEKKVDDRLAPNEG